MSDNLTSNTIKELIEKIESLTSIVATLMTALAAQTKIIETQDTIIEKLKEEIRAHKERLNKNSKNSSKPPSSDGLNKPNPKSLRKFLVNYPVLKKDIKVMV